MWGAGWSVLAFPGLSHTLGNRENVSEIVPFAAMFFTLKYVGQKLFLEFSLYVVRTCILRTGQYTYVNPVPVRFLM